jgi:PAS domain S-box-containing protein/excisionase family DNA binding protein
MNTVDRKKVEEVLRIRDNAIETSISAIALADLKGKLTYVNHSFLELWGYEKENDVIGKHVSIFWQKEEEAGEITKLLYEKGSWNGEMIAKKNDGSIFNAQISARVITDGDNNPAYMIGSFIDITKLKMAEEAIKQSEYIYKILIEASPDGVVVIDLNGTIIEASKRTIELFGYSRLKSLLGKNVFEIVSPQDRKKARDYLKETLKKDFTKNVELTLLKKDGSELIGELTASLIKDTHGKPKAILVTGRDITLQKNNRPYDRPKPSIMTVKELAKYMRVHTSTIYRLVRENKIPAIKVGNQWRFKKDSIDKWIEHKDEL